MEPRQGPQKGLEELPFLRQCLLPGLFSLLIALAGPSVRAQNSAPQTTATDESPILRLEHTQPRLATPANAVGQVEGSRPLQRMLLVLSPDSGQEADLQKLIEQQHTRKSPNYHHWLTPAQFGAQFGASDANVETARAWLQASGFTVERVAASKRWVEFTGTAAQVESAFHTVMQYYRVSGKTYVANSTDLGLPASLSGIIRGVLSLNNFEKSPPIREEHGVAGRDAEGKRFKLSPNLTAIGATNTYYMAPGDFAAIYDTYGLLSGGIDGTGVSIAVTGQSDIEVSDVQDFRQIFGLKVNDPNILVSGADPGIADLTDSEEALLDVEWAGAVAPGATINLVVAGSTDTTSGVDLAAAYAIDNQVAPILTYTYGSCEQALGTAGNAFYNALWQQAAAEGITVLVASGDNGAAGCDNPNAGAPAALGMAVNGVASTPYNVAVGGTEFADGTQPSSYWCATNSANYASAMGYIPEASWNESCDPGQTLSVTNCAFGGVNFSLLASGGGASTVYTKPSWQAGPGVPADGARDVPDLALAAATLHDEAVYCTSLAGTPCQINAQQEVVGLTLVGGTSLSTPAMAGILALVEQKNGAFQGQVNYLLYQLAQTPANTCNSTNQTNPTAQNACVFYDVTSGSNAVPCAAGTPDCSSNQSGVDGFTNGEAAGPGYNLATGLGSVNATNLANAWNTVLLAASQTTLQASSSTFVHGTPITLNGSVAPASGTGSPTGAVSLKTNLFGNTGQTLQLTNGGTFTGTVSNLPGGQYNLNAYYAGDGSYAPSSSSVLALNVTPESSVTSLSSSATGTVAYGSPLLLTVNTSGTSGQGTPTGTVTIRDGATLVGTYSLASNGGASISSGGGSAYSFAPGTHSVTAVYSGDNSFNSSTSSPIGFTVGKGTPFVVVGVNTSALASGETLGVHAVVSGQGTAAATGTIQFTVDGAATGSPVTLQTGGFFGTQAQAAALISNLPQGTHVIGASYDATADLNYSSVASGDPVNELTQTVTVGANAGNKSTTTLTIKTAPLNLGDTGMFTVTVSPTTATGAVTLWDAVGPRTAATPISSGTATIQFPWTQAGTTSLYALYSGDPTNAGSASSPVSFTVQKGAPQVNLVAPATTAANQQVSLNASVIGNPANSQLPYPTGMVEFWDSLDGAAAQLLTVQSLTVGAGEIGVYSARLTLSPGVHSLHVHYRGDANWQAADSSPQPLQVSSFTLTVPPSISFSAGSAGSTSVQVTPSGGFLGSVALTCPSGGTFLPAGYTCNFSVNPVVINSTSSQSSTITLTPTSTSSSAVKIARHCQKGADWWGTSFAAALLLFALAGWGFAGDKSSRNFFLAGGLVLCVTSAVSACGGGSSGGLVSTSTSIVSTDLRVAYGTPVTFTVTVTPHGSASPSGFVQLYDNGQTYASQVRVVAGIANILATTLPVGVHSITADYLGDQYTQPSVSAPITQIVTGTVPVQISGTSNGITQTASFNVILQ